MNRKDIFFTVKKTSWIILAVTCILEVCIFPEYENLFGCLAAIYGWFLISHFVFNRENYIKIFLPTFAISNYGFCYCILPLIATLIEGKPLTFNFQVAFETFINQMLSCSVMVASFLVCKKIYRRNNILNRIWNKIGLLSPLSDKYIWVFGILGFIVTLYTFTQQGENVESSASGNLGYIIISTVSTFATFPVCLYFKNFYTGDTKKRGNIKIVLIWIAILTIMGIATTRRTLMFNSIIIIALSAIVNALINNYKVQSAKNIVLFILGLYLITGPIANIAIAMSLNRQQSYSSSYKESFDNVIKLYNDKEVLHNLYQAALAATNNEGDNSAGWSEYYVDNIFLDRFCNLRVMDATIYNAKQAGYDSPNGHTYFENYIINQIPSFITNSIGLKKVIQGTATDNMLIANFGANRYSIYGSKVGGESGIGLWMFGYSYYIFSFFIFLIAFYVMTSFTNIKDGKLRIPIFVSAYFVSYWMLFINANGIFTIMDVFTRNKLDLIIIYCITLLVFRLIIPKVYK